MPSIALALTIDSMGGGDLLAKLFGNQYFADWDPALPSRRVETYLDGAGEQVTNGTFAADTDWTKGTGWTITGGEAVATGVLAAAYLEQTCLTVGATYAITFTVTASANTTTPYAGTQAGVAAGAGTHTQIIVANGTALKFGGHASGFTGTIDNVSAVELPACDVLNKPGCRARMLADPAVLDACDLVAVDHATALKYQEGGWSGDGKGCLVALGGQYGTADALAGKYTGTDKPIVSLAVVDIDSATSCSVVSCGRSSSNTPLIRVMHIAGDTDRQLVRDDASNLKSSDGTVGLFTGAVVYTVSMPDGDNVWSWINDTASIIASDRNVGATTLNQLTVGVSRGATSANYMVGSARRIVMGGSVLNTVAQSASKYLQT